ncbi:M48 family metallopeptidase [bacterium]|nr:M48 family metallopeptidase [bacterium]
MNIYLILVLVFYVGFFLFDVLVDVLNVKCVSTQVPDEFVGIYDADRYSKSQLYLRETTRFSMIQHCFMGVVVVCCILLGGFNVLDVWVRGFGFSELITGVVYMLGLGLLMGVLSLPFSLYSTFVIEEKYGFNKTTFSTFFGDLLKSLLIMAIIGSLLLFGVLWFFTYFGAQGWLYVCVFIVCVQLFLMYIAPTVIMPLFNKFEAVEEGELRDKIMTYAKKHEFALAGVYKMDGSKRSSKSNAFFTGFGKQRRIVLFDTLIEKHTTDELLAVLAHEMGHYKLKHIHKMVSVSIISSFVMFYIFSLFINNEGLAQAFQMKQASLYTSLIFFGFLYQPISVVLGIASQLLSRKHEFEADAFAVRTTGLADDMVMALKRLSVDNLSNLTPHWLKVFVEYSHPPVLERIKAIRRLG